MWGAGGVLGRRGEGDGEGDGEGGEVRLTEEEAFPYFEEV